MLVNINTCIAAPSNNRVCKVYNTLTLNNKKKIETLVSLKKNHLHICNRVFMRDVFIHS